MTPEQQLIEGVLHGAVGHYNMVDLHALCKQAEEALAAYRASLASDVQPKGTEEPPTVEAWCGERKVTIYAGENVMCMQGKGHALEFVSDVPHTLDSARAALDWLYAQSPAPAPAEHIAEPYTLAELRAKIASNDYSAELLLQHAMLLLEQAPAVGAAIVEDAATVLERRDEFGHSHKGDAAALREWASGGPLQRLHDLITDGDAPHWPNLPQTDLASRWYVTLCEAIEREFNGASHVPVQPTGGVE